MQHIIHIIVGLWLLALTAVWMRHVRRDDRRWQRIMQIVDRIESDLQKMESLAGEV